METKRSKTSSQRLLLTGFMLFIILGASPSSALDIHADSEVVVQNGTTGVLHCSFKSSEVVGISTSVTWSFQSSQPDTQFSKAPYVIFYFFNGRSFPAQNEFKDRVQFVGDINKRDVSIQLSPAQFSDNGTFFCDVKNPPDVTGTPARTELRVVLKGPGDIRPAGSLRQQELFPQDGAGGLRGHPQELNRKWRPNRKPTQEGVRRPSGKLLPLQRREALIL
ncbi:myelin protein zero-like 1 like isoform X2 [Antennarius striatus]|uniref:myelin protein zero-like 1 like isoform X2 n=1 Tax=Antennarius striatus TaxID=241820 RepID=UPI0035AF4AA3